MIHGSRSIPKQPLYRRYLQPFRVYIIIRFRTPSFRSKFDRDLQFSKELIVANCNIEKLRVATSKCEKFPQFFGCYFRFTSLYVNVKQALGAYLVQNPSDSLTSVTQEGKSSGGRRYTRTIHASGKGAADASNSGICMAPAMLGLAAMRAVRTPIALARMRRPK